MAAIILATASGCGGATGHSSAGSGGFGTGGKVLTAVKNGGPAEAVAIQDDGKIVVAGPFDPARYTPRGRLDASFGSGGKIGWRQFAASAIAIQRDGKIVLAGSVPNSVIPVGDREETCSDFALARYTANGRLDSSFGSGGKVRTHLDAPGTGSGGWPDTCYGIAALALQPDGKVVAGGNGGFVRNWALVRYTEEGRLDLSFGSAGKVLTRAGSGVLGSVAIADDGKIVIAGGFGETSAGPSFGVTRYTPDGRVDPRFGKGGHVLTAFVQPAWPFAVAFESEGKILAGGRGASTIALARYTSYGRLDRSFGRGGEVESDVKGRFYNVYAMALGSDDKIVVVGESAHGYKTSFMLARYTRDGRVDRSFGKDGSVEAKLGPFSSARGVAIQRDGKIVAVGQGGGLSFALARFTRDGRLDK